MERDEGPGRETRTRQVYLVVTSRLPLARCVLPPFHPASDPYSFFSLFHPSIRPCIPFLRNFNVTYICSWSIMLVFKLSVKLSHGYNYSDNVHWKQKEKEEIIGCQRKEIMIRKIIDIYYLISSFYNLLCVRVILIILFIVYSFYKHDI